MHTMANCGCFVVYLLLIAVVGAFKGNTRSITRDAFVTADKARPVKNNSAALRPLGLNRRSLFAEVGTSEMAVVAKEEKEEKLSNLQLRWITGLLLGTLATLWIHSPTWVFGSVFALVVALTQREYYRIVRATGIEPAVKTGITTSVICTMVAAFLPRHHEAILPLAMNVLMLWLLVFKRRLSSISEISTTILGMIYFGHLPSFWMRLRFSLSTPRTTLFPSVPLLSQGTGAMVLWWTWCSIVFSDVGAYFCGKSFGKHKLSSLFTAAGDASPNKTVEGAIGGMLSCAAFFTVGARMMQWPRWQVWGPVYGESSFPWYIHLLAFFRPGLIHPFSSSSNAPQVYCCPSSELSVISPSV